MTGTIAIAGATLTAACRAMASTTATRECVWSSNGESKKKEKQSHKTPHKQWGELGNIAARWKYSLR